jgi:hypothetical protein
VSFFSWTSTLGKILTMDNLWKLHVIVVDWCCMYKRSGEFVDHLLLHCEIASALWSAIFSLVGLAWVTPKRVVDLFACWRGFGRQFSKRNVWKMVSSCLLWCLWREINDRSFEHYESLVTELKSFFFKNLYYWTTVLDFNMLSFHDLLELRLCAFNNILINILDSGSEQKYSFFLGVRLCLSHKNIINFVGFYLVNMKTF